MADINTILKLKLLMADNGIVQCSDLGRFNTLDLLLEHANINANHQDVYGYTVLSLATTKVYQDIVSVLLEKTQVDIDLVDYIGGVSPLTRAARGNHRSGR